MITEIDGLKIPPTLSTTMKLVRNDTTNRTVTGKPIKKLGYQYWEANCDMGDTILSLEFQKSFYEKCMKARSESVVVKFISPYTQEEVAEYMMSTELTTPSVLEIMMNKPRYYSAAGATFEGVNPWQST